MVCTLGGNPWLIFGIVLVVCGALVAVFGPKRPVR